MLKDQKKKDKDFSVDKLNCKNPLGCTPVRLAASAGHPDCMIWLMNAGADINISDIKGQTPLAVACKQNHTECMRLLLEAGADPAGDLQNICSPIYLAAMNGFLEGLKLLVQYGADLNGDMVRMLNFGSSPLSVCITYHHWECFRFLLLSDAQHIVHNVPQEGAATTRVGNWKSGEMSLYHIAIKYDAGTHYADLIYNCGHDLYVRDDKGRLASEADFDNHTIHHIRQYYVAPHTLFSLCRIHIRRILGQQRLKCIAQLPLPNRLIGFLQHTAS